MSRLRLLLTDRKGATAIEYGLIASLIAMAIFGGVSAAGGEVGVQWDKVSTEVIKVLRLSD